MNAAFERAGRFSQGYSTVEVDEFLSRARAAYEGSDNGFKPSEIITASFTTERGGYDMRVVDEALDRLSDAFALQYRDNAIARDGEEAWVEVLTQRATVLRERLERPEGQRFRPGGEGERSYDRADVDALCDQVLAYFTQGHAMSVDDVRRAAFGRAKGAAGYDESVVDVYFDHVADIMASVP